MDEQSVVDESEQSVVDESEQATAAATAIDPEEEWEGDYLDVDDLVTQPGIVSAVMSYCSKRGVKGMNVRQLNAVLQTRRTGMDNHSEITTFTIQLTAQVRRGRYLVIINEQELFLTHNLFQILVALVIARGRSGGGYAWLGRLVGMTGNTLHVAIRRLRGAIDNVLGVGTGSLMISHATVMCWKCRARRSASMRKSKLWHRDIYPTKKFWVCSVAIPPTICPRRES
jgi:hypothetical protein